MLGGSAIYASFAGSYFAPMRLLGVVGNDFDAQHLERLKRHKIDLDGLIIDRSGPTLFWKGQYHENFSSRETLETQLNVFETFCPILPDVYSRTPYLLLGNIDPKLQLHVLDQFSDAPFVVVDTIDLWIETRHSELCRLIQRTDLLVLNDKEATLLSGESNQILAGQKLREMGPKSVIIKKGEHGAFLFHDEGLFPLPAFPVTDLQDPTGAGDAFAGALISYLATVRSTGYADLKRAMAYATVTASMVVEAFSCERLFLGGSTVLAQRFQYLCRMIAL